MFMQFFLQIRNQLKILRFLIGIIIFLKKVIFSAKKALFANFEAKCAGNGAKQCKIVFL